jgi:epoxyqueuosine reductase QueG
MKDVLYKLNRLMDSVSFCRWGIADINGLHPLAGEYPKAISILVSYQPGFREYSEPEYHLLLEETLRKNEAVVAAVSDFLISAGIKHMPMPLFGQDPETLLGAFSHKMAAVRAGLGWIGKSTLLVTSEHGPRVKLSTVLVDCDFPCSGKVAESECGDCRVCIDACPYGCIKGHEWRPGIEREEMLDAFTCSARREAFRSRIGHKHECGLCLLACPIGKI